MSGGAVPLTFMRRMWRILLATILLVAHAQSSTVFAQESATDASDGPCGGEVLTIAQMQWPSAAILANIHALLLRQSFECAVDLVPGDLGSTSAAMVNLGRPHIAPEMWLGRVASIWNSALETQRVRAGAPTFSGVFEAWFIPQYVKDDNPELDGLPNLLAFLSELRQNGKPKPHFISCPPDWACALLNKNLLAAHGLEDLLEVVEPSNRFEFDQLIGSAVSRHEPFVFYYWQPNSLLEQFDFVPLKMGLYNAEAVKCLGQRSCQTPKPSAFPPEQVFIALSEDVFAKFPIIAGYFQHATVPLSEMNALLAWQNEGGFSPEQVAAHFVETRSEIWRDWVD